MSSLVLREDKEGLAILTLNRPEKLNALTVSLFKELQTHIANLKIDESIGCVVLRGAGKCFSAGNDLDDISTGDDQVSPGWQSKILREMELLPKPVIAAVHGHCYTGGFEVALAADFILASDTARFADTHSKWALTPVWGMSQRLPRRVGIATAKKLIFTAEFVKADEALRIGICEAVFPQAEFEDSVERVARQILENSPFSHSAYKDLLLGTDSFDLESGLKWEVENNAGTGPDMQARISAFTQKSK